MKVRLRKHQSGKKSWQLDCGIIAGRRVQIGGFRSREEAETERVRRMQELKADGHSGVALSAGERARMVEARDKLAAAGATIEEAVEYFLKHAKPVREAVTFATLHGRCQEAKMEARTSLEYQRQIKSVGVQFARAGNAARPAHEITRDDVLNWLRANDWAPATWNNYLTDLRTIFEWGKSQGYVTRNPCEGIDRKKTHDGEIRFLSVDACERLLLRAAKAFPPLPRYDAQGRWIPVKADVESFQDFLPFVTIGLFCGPRPDKELGGMPCTDIKLDRGHEMIVITAGRAKSRRRRTVDLPPNAVAWLRYAKEHCGWTMEGKLLPRNFKKRWKRLREHCGLFADWPHDAMRHTFATYEYALEQNEAKLQVKMAHRSAQMLHAHYRGLTTSQEAARFRALMPPVEIGPQ